MRLKSINIQDFRNLVSSALDFSPGINIFHGKNAQGKTNLLDAVYLLAHLSSFRTSRVSELVCWEKKRAKVEGLVQVGEETHKLKVSIGEGGRRLFVNDMMVKEPRDFFMGFRVVVFSPDQVDIIKGNPSNRRKYLDRSAFRRSSEHLVRVRNYNKVLRNRNISLKEGRIDLVDLYGRQLARYGGVVTDARLKVVSQINEILSEIYYSVVGVKNNVEIKYESKWALDKEENISSMNEDILEEKLYRSLKSTVSLDRSRGYTSLGPHTDDISFTLDGFSAGRFASQGQVRSIMVSLNMTEYHILHEILGDPPVVLLDDLSSELDVSRRRHLLNYINELEGQAFVTTTDTNFLNNDVERKEFLVHDGVISNG